MSVKFLSAILGPEMAAPILWTPGKMRPFCRKNHVHKIPRLRGGGIWVFFWGGGKCRFYFYGREDFSDEWTVSKEAQTVSKKTPTVSKKASPIAILDAKVLLAFSEFDFRERSIQVLAHQNSTIAIASDFRVDGAKSPEILQKEGFWAKSSQPKIANR